MPRGLTALDVRYDALGPGAHGLGMHRAALFDVLQDAARGAGAELVFGRAVTGGAFATMQGRLVFADGASSARFDLVIDALGARSPLSRPAPPLSYGALWANAPASAGDHAEDRLEQRYVSAAKMVGVLPIGRRAAGGDPQISYFWSLRRRDYAAWRAQPIEAWKREALALWPETAPFLARLTHHDDFVFAAYAHRTLRQPVAGALVHVGDAWHSASPQLGQGANMALLDAYALASALRAQDDLATALAEYARVRLWHVRLYQLASWALTPAYQSDGALFAWARDALAGPAARLWPGPQILAALVTGVVGAPLHAIEALRGRTPS
jgi:2-polyprenyl-6-methoxyphenol hydroxylase-like FAD-dependent oxidoreductase